MRQSLAFSTDYYETVHSLIGGEASERNNRWIGLLVFDYFFSSFPMGSGCLHEEWHRAVLGKYGYGSFNEVNLFPIGADVIAVSHVDDRDLIELKRDHPADQVRLSAAGMESQIAQNLRIEKHHFFNELNTRDGILLWFNNLNVSFYLASCASQGGDDLTDEKNREDGSDISRRDFTGLDCTAWVYDLFRPDEPYTARGVHPSGVGINRYRHFSELTKKEQDFLVLQRNLSLLNFADPFLFKKNFFAAEIGGQSYKWNAKLNHYLTSFGAVVDSLLFVQNEEEKYLLTWHHGMTDTRYLPGLTVERLDQAMPWNQFFISWGLTYWPQPKDQRVENASTEDLFDVYSEFLYKIDETWSSYVEFEAKTPGWVAGQVALGRNFSTILGVKATVF
jgi:hypothetical protein